MTKDQIKKVMIWKRNRTWIGQAVNDPEEDPGSAGDGISSLEKPLLKRSNTLTSSHLAMVGAKVSHIESLDYE